MILGQFAVSGKIDITLWLQVFGYSDRYIQNHLDKYHYILHSITEKKVFNKSIGAEGFVSLNGRYLESFLGCRYYHEVRTNLIAWGMLECDGSYSVGNYSLGYRISPAFQGKAVLRNVYKGETMDRKLAKLQADYHAKDATNKAKKNLKQIGIRADAAISYIEKKYAATIALLLDNEGVLDSIIKDNHLSFLSSSLFYTSLLSSQEGITTTYPLMSIQLVKKAFQVKDNQHFTLYDLLIDSVTNQYNMELVAVNKIATGNLFWEQPDKTSRVFTNVSNLSTDLRQFLVKKGSVSNLVNLDIRNSQPYLLALLICEKYQGKTLPDDCQHYINLCAGGKFYEYMMNLLSITTSKRKAFKIKFFASLFFCKNLHSNRTESGKVFKKFFPNVAQLISEQKEEDYRQLAITMQRREANIILNTIGKQLQKKGIWYVTIHDSVVVAEEDVQETKSIILTSFEAAVGVAPTIEEDVLVEAKNVDGGNHSHNVEEAELLGGLMMLENWKEYDGVADEALVTLDKQQQKLMEHADFIASLYHDYPPTLVAA